MRKVRRVVDWRHRTYADSYFGLAAAGGEEPGSILLCSMHDPCGVQNLQLMAGRSVMPSPPEKLVPWTDGDERLERARVSKRLKSKM